MKTFFSCLLVLFSLQASPQSDSTVNDEIRELQRQLDEQLLARQNLEATVKHIQVNLVKHHETFKAGVGMGIAGVAASMLAVGLIVAAPELAVFLAVSGTMVSFAGLVTTIRSHRFIGFAGRKAPAR